MTDYSQLVAEIIAEAADYRSLHQIEYYIPYLKQREFHRLGSSCSERALIAGNQVGKSHCGGAENTYHVTGVYPDWWEGKRFNHPVKLWLCGPNMEKVRDTLQSTLFGHYAKPAEFGTGMLPRDAIVGKPSSSRGVQYAYDTAVVRWKDKNGRLDESALSTITQKAYTEGAIAFASDTIDIAHEDEEPPLDVHTEIRTRVQVKKGITYLTTTPLLGWTPLITRMLKEPDPDRGAVKMGLFDACKGHDPERPHLGHYTREQAEALIRGFPNHLRDAKAYGEPALGEGKIFLVPEGFYKIQRPDVIPPHWRKIWGLDFGGAGENSHPFGADLVAHDLDHDIIYVLAALKMRGMSILQHVPKIREIAPNVVCAWPHDGNEIDRGGSGATLAQQYRKPMPGMPGLNMLPEHATWPQGGFHTQPAIDDVDNRMQTGRLKICDDLVDLFDEIRQYHRKDFKVVRENDDLLSGLFKAIMMLRFARPGYLIEPPAGKYARKTDEWWKPSGQAEDIDPLTGAGVPRDYSQGW